MINKKSKIILAFILLISVFLIFTGCSQEPAQNQGDQDKEKPKLVLADAGWDSIKFHNAVTQLILEEGYGYPTEIMNGSTPITFAALVDGDIDVYTEVWTTNLGDKYQEALDNKDIYELSINFDDNAQGLYVPTYVIKGDPERGIEPMAPDLKTVKDLKNYWELFKDPENPSKGRIYGSIPGWEADKILSAKVESYGLDETYTYFSPGSDTALNTSLVKAIREGDPWVGYNWEPTWIVGKYDLTLLEDEPYDEELWNDGYRSEFPPVPVTVCVHKDVMDSAPDVVDFLENYETSSALTSEALAYMEDNEATPEDAAKYFLQEHEDLWTSWVPEEIAAKVKNAL